MTPRRNDARRTTAERGSDGGPPRPDDATCGVEARASGASPGRQPAGAAAGRGGHDGRWRIRETPGRLTLEREEHAASPAAKRGGPSGSRSR